MKRGSEPEADSALGDRAAKRAKTYTALDTLFKPHANAYVPLMERGPLFRELWEHTLRQNMTPRDLDTFLHVIRAQYSQEKADRGAWLRSFFYWRKQLWKQLLLRDSVSVFPKNRGRRRGLGERLAAMIDLPEVGGADADPKYDDIGQLAYAAASWARRVMMIVVDQAMRRKQMQLVCDPLDRLQPALARAFPSYVAGNLAFDTSEFIGASWDKGKYIVHSSQANRLSDTNIPSLPQEALDALGLHATAFPLYQTDITPASLPRQSERADDVTSHNLNLLLRRWNMIADPWFYRDWGLEKLAQLDRESEPVARYFERISEGMPPLASLTNVRLVTQGWGRTMDLVARQVYDGAPPPPPWSTEVLPRHTDMEPLLHQWNPWYPGGGLVSDRPAGQELHYPFVIAEPSTGLDLFVLHFPTMLRTNLRGGLWLHQLMVLSAIDPEALFEALAPPTGTTKPMAMFTSLAAVITRNFTKADFIENEHARSLVERMNVALGSWAPRRSTVERSVLSGALIVALNHDVANLLPGFALHLVSAEGRAELAEVARAASDRPSAYVALHATVAADSVQ